MFEFDDKEYTTISDIRTKYSYRNLWNILSQLNVGERYSIDKYAIKRTKAGFSYYQDNLFLGWNGTRKLDNCIHWLGNSIHPGGYM